MKGVSDYPFTWWDASTSVIFHKTREEWGELSNMCAGFPIVINGNVWLTSEAVYQAFRFPEHPEIQELIRKQKSPMAAKMKSKPNRASSSRVDWDLVRVDIMDWCLRAKLVANFESFGGVLRRTGKMDIVERSTRDQFWGAKEVIDGALQGQNVLGRLLVGLRAACISEDVGSAEFLQPPVDDMVLLGLKTLKVTAGPSAATLF